MRFRVFVRSSIVRLAFLHGLLLSASMVAVLGGIDALVFSGGIGEHSPFVRERVATAAAWTGLKLDHAANEAGSTDLAAADSAVKCLVQPSDEEALLAFHALPFLPAA